MPLKFINKYFIVYIVLGTYISAASEGQTQVINSCQTAVLWSLDYLNSLTCNGFKAWHLLTLHYMQ